MRLIDGDASVPRQLAFQGENYRVLLMHIHTYIYIDREKSKRAGVVTRPDDSRFSWGLAWMAQGRPDSCIRAEPTPTVQLASLAYPRSQHK